MGRLLFLGGGGCTYRIGMSLCESGKMAALVAGCSCGCRSKKFCKTDDSCGRRRTGGGGGRCFAKHQRRTMPKPRAAGRAYPCRCSHGRVGPCRAQIARKAAPRQLQAPSAAASQAGGRQLTSHSQRPPHHSDQGSQRDSSRRAQVRPVQEGSSLRAPKLDIAFGPYPTMELPRAFLSEVDSGSREENAIRQKTRAFSAPRRNAEML